MKKRIIFVERKPSKFVSIEKAFRSVAERLSDEFEYDFQQVSYGNRFSDTIRNLLAFRKRPADIYHLTGHIHYIGLLFSRKNTVLSIMDVRFLYDAKGLRYWLLKKLYLDWPVRHLDFITAISDQTKAEIVEFSGCNPEKIRVLDLPLLIQTDTAERREFDAEMPIILQVGTMKNKNIPNLARALAGINAKLRIIGRLDDEQISILAENKINYENAFDLTDDELRDEYRNADIVAFCSIYEGFGLPIIEGQSMRKPVITSNVSPMIETSGRAAALVDPNEVSSIRAAIERVIADSGYRDELIKAGLRNIERFSPSSVARQYEKLYNEIS